MKKKSEELFTVMVWNTESIQIRRGVPASEVQRVRFNMQTTISDGGEEPTDDPRWQAWMGHAKVEVL